MLSSLAWLQKNFSDDNNYLQIRHNQYFLFFPSAAAAFAPLPSSFESLFFVNYLKVFSLFLPKHFLQEMIFNAAKCSWMMFMAMMLFMLLVMIVIKITYEASLLHSSFLCFFATIPPLPLWKKWVGEREKESKKRTTKNVFLFYITASQSISFFFRCLFRKRRIRFIVYFSFSPTCLLKLHVLLHADISCKLKTIQFGIFRKIKTVFCARMRSLIKIKFLSLSEMKFCCFDFAWRTTKKNPKWVEVFFFSSRRRVEWVK